MSPRIIGIGMHRTGTLSIKVALEQLGIAPCYHGYEYIGRHDHEAFWRKAIDSDGDVDWTDVFAGYQAVFDWPTIYFWRQVVAAFPDAKVLLTDRDPGRWYESHLALFQGLLEPGGPQPRYPGLAEIIQRALFATFEGRPFDRQHAIGIYTRHYERVRATVPADRLLVYRVEQGWEPLCRLLDLDPPDVPFPRVNTRDGFLRNVELANTRDTLETQGIPWQ